MSYLYRSGNGRNNIAYTNTANSSTKYLRRTGTGRTNITWTTIPTGSTYNILQRNGTGRNSIAWGNLQIISKIYNLTQICNIMGNGILYIGHRYTNTSSIYNCNISDPDETIYRYIGSEYILINYDSSNSSTSSSSTSTTRVGSGDNDIGLVFINLNSNALSYAQSFCNSSLDGIELHIDGFYRPDGAGPGQGISVYFSCPITIAKIVDNKLFVGIQASQYKQYTEGNSLAYTYRGRDAYPITMEIMV